MTKAQARRIIVNTWNHWNDIAIEQNLSLKSITEELVEREIRELRDHGFVID